MTISQGYGPLMPWSARMGLSITVTVNGNAGSCAGTYSRLSRPGIKRQALERIKEEVLERVPGAGIAADQLFRLFDLAIDYAEDVPPARRRYGRSAAYSQHTMPTAR